MSITSSQRRKIYALLSLLRPACTGSYHCHFPAERPTFSPAGSCLLTPSANQSTRPFSAPRRSDPQRGATSPPVQHMRAPHRRISIRVATLGKAGQFSPVRGIGLPFVGLYIFPLFRSLSTQ